MERVTTSEAAERLGITPDAVRSRLRRGLLAGEKDGNTWYVFMDSDSQTTVNDSQTVKSSSRATVHATVNNSQMTVNDSQTVGEDDPALRLAVLEADLRGARALLTYTQDQLAAAREEANFLRERLTAQEAIIAQLAEAQTEAWRRRDVLEAQARTALPETAGKRETWWQRLTKRR